MSYDLMVFDPASAPRDEDAFLSWYRAQTEWTEDHSYEDPQITTPALAEWFAAMSKIFPSINGPHATDDYDHPNLTDYSIGRTIIYVAFPWPQAENAYETVTRLAAEHSVGFFDASGNGEVRFP